jgi:hypothetical protein
MQDGPLADGHKLGGFEYPFRQDHVADLINAGDASFDLCCLHAIIVIAEGK